MRNNKPSGDEEKTDPKEDTKLTRMDNHEADKDSELTAPKSSRLDELRGRAKKFASNRYHLIILLLCIVLLILFIIVLALSVQLGNYQCQEKFECRTSECLLAASAVVSRSDTTLDPCSDFWSYSCNGWTALNPLPNNKGSHSVSDTLNREINNRLRHLIDLVPHDADPTSYQSKVKDFYTVCMGLKNIEYWVPDKIRQAVREIGGWAIIKEPPGGQWSRNDVLKKLHVSFGVHAFFRLVVEASDTHPMKNIIKLVPDGLGLPSPRYYFKPHDDPYVKAYKDFIKNTMQGMGVPLHEATTFSDEVFHYEKRVAEVTPTSDVLRKTKDLYKVMAVYELDRLSITIPWTDILQTYFPGLIQANTEIAVLSENYFQEISRIISSTDNSVLNNYYMWRFMSKYVPHSSSRFRLVVNHYEQTLEGVSDLNLKHEDYWESCIHMTSQYLGHALGAMYIDHYVPKKLQEEIQVYLHKLVGAISDLRMPWIQDEETRNIAKSKIRSLLLLGGYPNVAKNPSLGTYYKELRVETDYFQNLKDGVYFLHKKQEEMLKRKNVVPDDSWTIYPHESAVEYKYPGNNLVVPAALFESPLFDNGAPLAVKYGVLAGHVANKISEIFDDKGVNYNEDGALSSWRSNASIASFDEKQECLKRFITNVSLHDVHIDPDLTLASFIADIGGVKLAYQAYKKHAREIGTQGVLPGMNIDNNQLFFISYAQSLCQTIRPEKLRAIRESSISLPAELRVFGTLQQTKEFSNAFSCPVGSVMNAHEQCHMW